MESTEQPNDLFPYQNDAVQWLAARRQALLALDMGLGKTAVSIRAADLINARRILVLCPASARENWAREFRRWSRGGHDFIHVATARSTLVDRNCAGVVITSYDLASTIDQWGALDLLLLDESHMLKSKTTKRTQAVLSSTGLIHKAAYTWALSGTPAPNHAGELWPLLFTFGVTKLTYDQFVDRYCTHYEMMISRFKRVKRITGTKMEAIPELKQLLAPVIHRKKMEDVMPQLPKINYENIVVEPNEVILDQDSTFVQYTMPPSRRDELFAKLERERRILSDLFENVHMGERGGGHNEAGVRILSSIADSVSTLRMYTGAQKVNAVAELVRSELEANAYEKVVIFAVHQTVIEGLRVKLREFGAVTLYGKTPAEKRQAHIDKFQTNPKCRVFIGNIQAAGTAITLTAANQIIFVEQSWVPGDNVQAAKRCHRIGQTRPVFVRFVGLAGSIDEKIAVVLKAKSRALTKIFDEEVARVNT